MQISLDVSEKFILIIFGNNIAVGTTLYGMQSEMAAFFVDVDIYMKNINVIRST